MNTEEYWQIFEKSGRVEDFLNYRNNVKNSVTDDERTAITDGNRNSDKGNQNKGKR